MKEVTYEEWMKNPTPRIVSLLEVIRKGGRYDR